MEFCLKQSDILKISEDEFMFLADKYGFNKSDRQDFCLRFKEKYANIEVVIITFGQGGAYCYADKMYFCPAKNVKVVSTVGAGDSFGAVFLAEYLAGKDVAVCLEKATERAGYVVSHFDAVFD